MLLQNDICNGSGNHVPEEADSAARPCRDETHLLKKKLSLRLTTLNLTTMYKKLTQEKEAHDDYNVSSLTYGELGAGLKK